jgi:hypothetical protein
MSRRPIAFNNSTKTANSIKKNNIEVGLSSVDYSTNPGGVTWLNGVDSTNQYVIYSDTFSLGMSTLANSKPVCWATGDFTDANVLRIINGLPTRFNQTPFTTINSALAWVAASTTFNMVGGTLDNIVTNGLVLNLDSSQKNSHPGSGTIWYDLSGNGNDASLLNGLQFNNTNSGEIYMDGGDEYIQVTPSSNLQSYFSNNSFTITLIVKSDNVVYPRSRCPIYVNSTVTGSSYKGWSAGHGASASSIQIRVGDGTNLSVADIPHVVSESTVYLRTFTVDRTNGALTKYYVNGSYIGQHNATNVTGSIYDGTNTDFVTGLVFGYVWGWRFIGGIYNIMVYNRLLSETEILQNYNTQKTKFGL